MAFGASLGLLCSGAELGPLCSVTVPVKQNPESMWVCLNSEMVTTRGLLSSLLLGSLAC